jgi:aminoglycoside 3-N-acetyltransferase
LLSKLGGQLLFIGCGLRPNTSMHGIEETIEPDYLFKGFVEYDVIDYNGQKSCRKCKRHNFKGFVQRYDRVQNILEKGEIKNGKILKAESYIIQAENLWKKAKKALSKDPHYFVDRLF